MAKHLTIINQLLRYVSGEIDLDEFRDWIVGFHIDNEGNLGEDALRLIYDFELRYAEYSESLVPEDVLRQACLSLVDRAARSEAEAASVNALVYFETIRSSSVTVSPIAPSGSVPIYTPESTSSPNPFDSLELSPA